MGNKGSNTTNTNSSSSSSTRPDDNAYQAYLALLNRASGVASTPYQGYGGEEVAPINQQQQAGFGAINTAQGAITATGAPISAADIQRYQDPYTNSVIDATQKDFDAQNARQQSQTTGNAAAQGALGGDRSAVAAALTAEGQSRSQAPVIAGLRSQGYQQAVKTAEDQQQQALRAGVAGLQGGQAMVGAGTLEQQTQQAKDTQDRLDYYQQQGYPFQVAQWLAQMTTGVGSQLGGTGTNTGTATTQGPTPNPWSQVAGLGLTAASLFANRGGRVSGVHQFADGGAIRLSDDELHAFREWKAQHYPEAGVHRYAAGGSPWGADQTWVPTVSGITTGRGAPQAPSLPSAPSAQQQKGLSNDQMKGIGTLGKAGVGGLSNWMNTGASDVSLADLGSAMSPLPGLDAYDYEGGGVGGNEMFAARGGRIAGFAEGGEVLSDVAPERISGGQQYAAGPVYQMQPSGGQIRVINTRTGQVVYTGTHAGAANAAASANARERAIGGRVRGYAAGGSPLLEDDDVVYRPMAAGVGASRPAFDVVNPDEPFRMLDRPTEDSEPPALEGWRKGVDKDVGLGQSAQNDAPLPPEVISGRSKPPIMAHSAPEEADEGPSTALGYSGAPRTISGVGAPPPQPEGASDEGFLSRLGVRMTPEIKQGLLQAGLSMMATRHGGAGSFLQSAGEAGMTGVGAYSQSQQLAREAEEKARKEAFEREKFERPYSAMTAAQRAAAAKELKPEYRVIRKEIDPDTGQVREVMGWVDPNTRKVTEEPGQTTKPPMPTTADSGVIDYSRAAPRVEKGAEVPEPKGIAGKSSASVKSDAEYYAQTGKLPPVRAGQSPVAVMQQSYRNAVQNYGNALAESRGINPSQLAEMWRTAPGQLRFVLGADGRATVSLGTAVRHLDTMRELAAAWGANDTQGINRVRAAIAKQFGGADATNIEAAGKIIGPEIVKAIGVAGAGTAEERKAVESAFSTAASPAQMLGAIRTTQALLGGQLEGRKRQAAAAGVSEEKFKSLIGDRPYEILTSSEKGHATKSETTTAAPAVGDKRNGWTFKGGDPAKKENWTKD